MWKDVLKEACLSSLSYTCKDQSWPCCGQRFLCSFDFPFNPHVWVFCNCIDEISIGELRNGPALPEVELNVLLLIRLDEQAQNVRPELGAHNVPGVVRREVLSCTAQAGAERRISDQRDQRST